jgi:hypothetical protein
MQACLIWHKAPGAMGYGVEMHLLFKSLWLSVAIEAVLGREVREL